MTILPVELSTGRSALRLTPERFALALWLVLGALLLWFSADSVRHWYGDADDALRLVQVRDLLAGQPWFDLTQHRLDPATGVTLHWSRLIDLPIAALILLFRLVSSPEQAEYWARMTWPLLTLLPALLAVAAIARTLSGERAAYAALCLTAISYPALWMYLPGRIDHHNVQLALSVWIVALILPQDRTALSGAISGALAALALAIGLETLPILALAIGMVGLDWCLRGQPAKAHASAFLATFALVAALLLSSTSPPAQWLRPLCDQISIAWLAPLAVGAASFLALAAIGPPSRLARFLGGGLVAALALAAMALLAPECLAGPYGSVDPRLMSEWMANIGEAKSLARAWADAPGATLALIVLPAVVSLGAAVLATRPRSRLWSWSVFAVLLAVQLGLTIWQVRGAPLANLLANAGLAAILAELSRRAPPARSLALLAGAVAVFNWGTVTAAALAVTPSPRSEAGGEGQQSPCLDPAKLRALSVLAPGIVLTELNSASALIAATPHAAVAGPYHRNGVGILATMDALAGSPDAARAILARHRATYVLVCRTRPRPIPFAPGTLGRLLDEGTPPDWLARESLPLAEPLEVYVVR